MSWGFTSNSLRFSIPQPCYYLIIMNDENKEPQLNNLPPANFNAPPKYNFKLILSVLGVFVVLLVVGFYVYQKHFSKDGIASSGQLTASENTAQETLKAGYSLYKDADTAISFQYPQTLSLLDRDEDGSKMLPNIFFNAYQYPDKHSRNVCPVDCINFSTFLRSENYLPYYDIPLRVAKKAQQFPIYSYPAYIYQDESGSKTFQINGMEAVRYYAAGFTDSYVNAYARDKATPVEYALEERVFIKDPNLNGRVVYVVYQEKTDKLPAGAEALSGSIIKGLFDQQKHVAFQDILGTVQSLPTNTNQTITQSSKELGVAFDVPKYWGALIESTLSVKGSDPRIEIINLGFKSPLFSWDDPAQIKFEADNEKTARSVYEGLPPLYQYAGQSLDQACQQNGYLDSSGSYEIKMTECNLRTLSNGTKIVVFKGNYAHTYEYSEGVIPADKRQFIPFKGAILQTKSTKWPGMSIHFEGTNTDFISTEKLFDEIINSLSYSK